MSGYESDSSTALKYPAFGTSCRLQRQKAPKFHLGVNPANFDSAKCLFETKGDCSPLSLSVDDTALAPKLRTLWDFDTNTWSLLGHVDPATGTSVGSELTFDDDDDLAAALKDNNLLRGNKVGM